MQLIELFLRHLAGRAHHDIPVSYTHLAFLVDLEHVRRAQNAGVIRLAAALGVEGRVSPLSLRIAHCLTVSVISSQPLKTLQVISIDSP